MVIANPDKYRRHGLLIKTTALLIRNFVFPHSTPSVVGWVAGNAHTNFEGGLNLLHKVDDDTVIRLESTATAALNEIIIIIMSTVVEVFCFWGPHTPYNLEELQKRRPIKQKPVWYISAAPEGHIFGLGFSFLCKISILS